MYSFKSTTTHEKHHMTPLCLRPGLEVLWSRSRTLATSAAIADQSLSQQANDIKRRTWEDCLTPQTVTLSGRLGAAVKGPQNTPSKTWAETNHTLPASRALNRSPKQIWLSSVLWID